MCTCITYENGDFYFGRNLDLEYRFGEKVVVTPRNYVFSFRKKPKMTRHYGMIGMATVQKEYPLYAEAVNEKGLGMAGLNFPGNAVYKEEAEDRDNIAPFELIPWVLGQCASVEEARGLLRKVHLLDRPFAEGLPLAPLHWMIADRTGCIVLEAVEDGVHIYENPYGVLTNNPPFPYYQHHLANYRNLSGRPLGNHFAEGVDLPAFGQGLGAVGLPGDFSPASRFVKAAFLKWNARARQEELFNVSQFFHVLDAVAMPRGAVITEEGREDITTYSCCVNADTGVYYYKTYDNSRIQAVGLRREDLETDRLAVYELREEPGVEFHN